MDLGHTIAVLDPAWSTLCQILRERRAELLESLIKPHVVPTPFGAFLATEISTEIIRGRILEIDHIMKILEHLKLEQTGMP